LDKRAEAENNSGGPLDLRKGGKVLGTERRSCSAARTKSRTPKDNGRSLAPEVFRPVSGQFHRRRSRQNPEFDRQLENGLPLEFASKAQAVACDGSSLNFAQPQLTLRKGVALPFHGIASDRNGGSAQPHLVCKQNSNAE